MNLIESHAMSGKKLDDVSYQYENGSYLRKRTGDNRLHRIKPDNEYGVSMVMV